MTAAVRPDASVKLTGSAVFGTDLDVPGMLWAAFVPAPVAHGRVRSLDLRAARALPGVTVVGPEELSGLVGTGERDPERRLFAEGEVLYRHQPLAVVAAPSAIEARAAVAAVRVEVDPLPVVADLEAVFPDWPGSAADSAPQVAAHVHARSGNMEAELRRADRVVSETYRTASVHQVALEPHACVAEIRGETWYVRTSTQSPFGVREDTASLLGIPEASLVVEGTWVGGGFGGKAASFLEPYALLLARATGRPVRFALGYSEEFRLGRTTLPAVIRMETAVRDGCIRARRVRLLLDVGNSLPGRDFATGYSIGFLLGPYRCEAFEVEGYGVRTHKPPFGPHRAPFAPQCAFVVESHLDHVARELNLDPEEFRARHLWKGGDPTPLGQKVGPFGLPAALERARATARRWRAEAPAGHGVGIGCGFWSTSTGAGGEVRLSLNPQHLVVLQGEREIGSGSVLMGLAAVVVRATGLPRDRSRSSTATPPSPRSIRGSSEAARSVRSAGQSRRLRSRFAGRWPSGSGPAARPSCRSNGERSTPRPGSAGPPSRSC